MRGGCITVKRVRPPFIDFKRNDPIHHTHILSHLRGHGHLRQGVRHRWQAQEGVSGHLLLHRRSGWHRCALYQDRRVLSSLEDGEPRAEALCQYRCLLRFHAPLHRLGADPRRGLCTAQAGCVCQEGVQGRECD